MVVQFLKTNVYKHIMSVLDYTYFDNNATVPMFPRAVKSYASVSACGNTSSANPVAEIWRQRANDFEYILRENYAAPEASHELIWTSGSTESNCTVISMFTVNSPGPKIILCTEIEHKCLKTAVEQAKESGTTVFWIPVRTDGTIDPMSILNTLIMLENMYPGVPTLVCCMHANNETGAINDLMSISNIIDRFRESREIYFYSDCAQTTGKEPIKLATILWQNIPVGRIYIPVSDDLEDLKSNKQGPKTNKQGTDVTGRSTKKEQKYIEIPRENLLRDLQDYVHLGTIPLFVKSQHGTTMMKLQTRTVLDGICFSGHKIGGPTGIGGLIISRRFLAQKSFIPISGAQNYGLRGGTYNMSGIIGLREAFMECISLHEKIMQACTVGKAFVLKSVADSGIPVIKYTEYLAGKQPEKCFVYFETDDPRDTLPSTLYCSLVYNSCDRQVCNLKLKSFFEQRKIIVSVGSACNSASSKMSHVLTAMLCPKLVALGVLRISGFMNGPSDYKKLSAAIIDAFSEMNKLCILRK